MQFSHIYLSIY